MYKIKFNYKFAPLLLDAYKLSHPDQFPPGTEYVYSNTTPRKSRIKGVDEVVVFGLQYFIKEYLINQWGEWFSLPKEEAISVMKRVTDRFLGEDSVKIARYEELHDLGYLPVLIKALPEGMKCPIGVPFMTIINTDNKFYWVTNMLETLTQTVIWQGITSATIAHQYRKLLNKHADASGDLGFVDFQGHDFSMRGMSSVETAALSAAAHLLSFKGTDTVPSLTFLEEYYNANLDNEFIGCSVPATEHAVMCTYGDMDERETFRHLIQDVYPNGIVSIVSDTWDLWRVLNEYMPSLKDVIMKRDGKLVVRPDSGDPVDITCGVKDFVTRDGKYYVPSWDNHNGDYNEREINANIAKGVVELLWDEFGGTINEKGYKVLDPHVGCIYGDSITLDRAQQICERLEAKGFASTNIVFGIGSFTYQYNTRDTFSIACKATWAQVNGETRELFKDPVTDDGTKKSAKGLLQVVRENGRLHLKDQATPDEESSGELIPVFQDGVLLKEYSLQEIRERLNA